jgi:hypothetical protein
MQTILDLLLSEVDELLDKESLSKFDKKQSPQTRVFRHG